MKNMTRMEAAIARAEEKLAEAREASARTDQAIARAQEAIDRFWANQEDRFWANQEKADAPAATLESGAEESPGNAGKSCSCRDSGSRQEIDFYRADALESRAGAFKGIDPDLLVDLVSDLLLLAGRMNEQIQAIQAIEHRSRRTRRRKRPPRPPVMVW